MSPAIREWWKRRRKSQTDLFRVSRTFRGAGRDGCYRRAERQKPPERALELASQRSRAKQLGAERCPPAESPARRKQGPMPVCSAPTRLAQPERNWRAPTVQGVQPVAAPVRPVWAFPAGNAAPAPAAYPGHHLCRAACPRLFARSSAEPIPPAATSLDPATSGWASAARYSR